MSSWKSIQLLRWFWEFRKFETYKRYFQLSGWMIPKSIHQPEVNIKETDIYPIAFRVPGPYTLMSKGFKRGFIHGDKQINYLPPDHLAQDFVAISTVSLESLDGRGGMMSFANLEKKRADSPKKLVINHRYIGDTSAQRLGPLNFLLCFIQLNNNKFLDSKSTILRYTQMSFFLRNPPAFQWFHW